MNILRTLTPKNRATQLAIAALFLASFQSAPQSQVTLQCYVLQENYCDPIPAYPETPKCSAHDTEFVCSNSIRRIWQGMNRPVTSASGSPTYTCYDAFCYYEYFCVWEDGECTTASSGVGHAFYGITCELGQPPQQGQQCSEMTPGGGGPD